MATVRVLIGGRDYEVACDNGQEGHLRHLAHELDQRVRGIGNAMGRPADPQLLMLAALMLTDELEESKREATQLRYDIQNSSHSFEQNKQIELENAIAATIHDIASRIESIADQLDRA